jgi:hypothetical protein
MVRISIPRTDQTDLSFDGQLLACSMSERDDQGRHYVVSTYQRDCDGALTYVPTIQFVSTLPSEASFTIAEVVEDPTDVQKFFYVFEPLEHLPCELVENMSARARQELTQQLFRIYDRAVAKTLTKLQGRVVAPQDGVQANSSQS